MVFLQHPAKLGRDPLRQENRHAGADTKKFEMWNRAQTDEDFFEFGITEEERVTAGEKHVAHFALQRSRLRALAVRGSQDAEPRTRIRRELVGRLPAREPIVPIA